MLPKKRIVLWDWTNTPGPDTDGVPHMMDRVPYNDQSPVASVVNWNAWTPPELKDRIPFRPMVRGMSNTTGGEWDMIENSSASIILFFNEPERAGISPEQARDIWYNQVLPMRKCKEKQLGSPAVASDNNGKRWLAMFMNLVKDDLPDYLCLHYYSEDVLSAQQYLREMHELYGLPIIVTEIACLSRDAGQVRKYTAQMCAWMDDQPWVFEYGFFNFQRKVVDDFVSPAAQLMAPDGSFTELGKMFLCM